jgi:plasmid maintenance system killer protein
MKKNKLLFIASGLMVAGGVALGVNSTLHASAATTQSQAISVKNVIPQQNVVDSSEVKITNKLDLANPGPIEHYIWNHRGDTDTIWHNKETGQWRIVNKFANGSSSIGIYTDGYYYQMFYDKNGNLTDSQKIPQSSSYTGKDSIFDSKKIQARPDLTDLGSSSYDGTDVETYQRVHKDNHGEQSIKYYVDKKYNLILKQESTVNNQTNVETWGYSYLQNDPSLFVVPSNITFKLLPSPDAPHANK